MMVDISTGKIQEQAPHDGTRASILDSLPGDDNNILVAHNKRDKQVFDVYRVNIKTGAETLAAKNPGNFTEWVTDHAGKIRGAILTDGVNTSLFYRDTEGDEIKSIVTTNFREGVAPVGCTADNKVMFVSSNRGRDKSALFEFDPKTAKGGKLVFEHPEVDVSTLGWSRVRNTITHTTVDVDKLEQVFFDKESERVYKAMRAKLPGYEINRQSVTKDEQKMIIAAYNDRTSGARYFYDVKANKLTKLTEINPSIAEADMAEMKPIQYTARDGLEIRGYLTLPKGVAAENLPVEIHPHGGTWARDEWGYNPKV